MWLNKALKLLWGKTRRQFLVCCKPTAVQTVLAERRGECLQCAKCCRLLFKCPFLSAENLCLIYKSTLRPKSCVHFPMSRADLEDLKTSSGHVCGYHFIFGWDGSDRTNKLKLRDLARKLGLKKPLDPLF